MQQFFDDKNDDKKANYLDLLENIAGIINNTQGETISSNINAHKK